MSQRIVREASGSSANKAFPSTDEEEKTVANSHEIAPEVHNGVSTLDQPSAAWGWSNLKESTIQKAGWACVLILLAYNFGNHHGHVETIYLFVFAAIIALILVLRLIKPKGKQSRTLTAKNQPQGYKEKDWTYLQATNTGPYAELTDPELRALNIEPSRVAHLRKLPAAK